MTITTITNLLFFLTILPITSPTLTSTITLPLSHFTKHSHSPPQNIYKHLNHLATTSLTRARHLKNATTTATTTTTTTPLSAHSYGGYSISLGFGTPPQTLPFIMDTGSSFVWFPCTHNYICEKCTFATSPSNITSFIPKLSSTAEIVGCLNPKCGLIHNPNTESRCSDCAPNSVNCTQLCPPYVIIYGSGSTGGLALLDTLTLNYEKVPGFLVGCSLFSLSQPAGIAGFGRGDSSVPSQLGLTKFCYCSISHNFDDGNVTTPLTLTGKENSDEKVNGVTYTPLLKNPKIPTKKSFQEYYYLGLNKILVGGKKVKYNGDFLSPPDAVTGFGGTIVDSGTTFTYMAREIYEPLAREIEAQVREYKRAEEVENVTGLRPCFNVPRLETVSLPSLSFHYKGGAKMEFPLENYFSIAGKNEAVCLTVVTDEPGQEMVSGPKVILGNYQQQNYYVEYDLKHNKFGFKPQKCG
ncbi:hypothetical protein RND81_05G255000 [Saponaria officinalis]|uniref:Peptidase A1 domain-containing protein n=1 Tax=Saponaria officinalis TaxID=3572 RepID=A0AAW1L3S5_SAPOF